MKTKKQGKIAEVVDPFNSDEVENNNSPKSNRDNIRKASDEFNSKTFDVKEKKIRKGFNIHVFKDTHQEFRRLYIKFLLVKESSVTDFFRIAVSFWKEKMIKEEVFVPVTDSFLVFASRKGARLKNSRSFKKSEVLSSFVNTTAETYNDYYSLMYSVVHQNDMEDLDLYSVSYFFYDFVDFLKNNINDIIKENRVDG